MILRSALLALLFHFLNSALAWNTPTTTAPANGSLNWVGTTVDWNAVVNSNGYQMQVDSAASFTSPLLQTVTTAYINSSSINGDTQASLSNLRFGVTYRWRVRAYVTGDTSAWSPVWTFNTRDDVSQVSPTSGSTTWTGMTMNWGTHAGVTFYDAQLDTTATLSSPVIRNVSNPYINSTDGNADTRWDVTDLYFGKTYHWRVRCRNAVDTSAWSPVWTFTTNNAVFQTSPASGSTTWTGMTMDWATHAGVTFYDAQLDTTATFSSPVIRNVSNPYINSTDGNADTRWEVTDLYFGKTYLWRVRCRNAVDTSAWSPVWTFTTRDEVFLSSPADGQLNVNTAGVTLNWSPHVGISLYQSQWDTTNLFNTGSLQSVDDPYINSTDGNADTQNPTGTLLPDQWYFWRVRAINAVDTSAWIVRGFSTGSEPIVLPETPTLISPTNTSTVNSANIDLVWSAVPDAGGYEYEISTFPDLADALALLIGGTQISYGPMSIGTTYYWRARSLQGGNASDWSPIWSFTYDPSTGVPAPEPSSCSVYPNPASDQLVVTLRGERATTMVLRDAGGRKVLSSRIHPGVNVIDLNSLAPGAYLLLLTDRVREAMRVVKQ